MIPISMEAPIIRVSVAQNTSTPIPARRPILELFVIVRIVIELPESSVTIHELPPHGFLSCIIAAITPHAEPQRVLPLAVVKQHLFRPTHHKEVRAVRMLQLKDTRDVLFPYWDRIMPSNS